MGTTIIALLSAVIGFLLGMLKDYMNNKYELKKIRFTKLHEKQACVVAELYSKIVNVDDKTKALFSPRGTLKPDERLPLAEELGNAMVEFLKFYRPIEIYLSDSTCNLINQLANSIKNAAGTYSIYLRSHQNAADRSEKKEAVFNELKAWEKGYNSLKDNGSLSEMSKKLKVELRDLIGTK